MSRGTAIVTLVSALSFALFGLGLSAEFERCSLLGDDRNDLCFKTILSEIIVKVGADGTNDDVEMEICSDRDSTECCKTPTLRSLLADDWSANDEETWGTSYFGKCKDQVFLVKRGLTVTLSKKNEDTLAVKSITIDTKSPDKKDKETERFLCSEFNLGKTNTKQTQMCKVGPYNFTRVFNAVFSVGKNKDDGTDDDVTFKICSDVNVQNCCEQKLSHKLSNDWKTGAVETWDVDQFGDCGKKFYKVKDLPILSVTKNGKDDLIVSNLAITFDQIDIPIRRIKYTCEGFSLKGDCKTPEVCTHTFRSCKGEPVNVASTSDSKDTKANAKTTSSTSSTSTTTEGRKGDKTTTTRPPFRSGR